MDADQVCGKILDETQFELKTHPGEIVYPVFCGVCQALTDCEPKQRGPRSFSDAMAGISTEYDLFVCPHADEDWHRQVVELRQEKSKTRSSMLRAILDTEINLIFDSKMATT